MNPEIRVLLSLAAAIAVVIIISIGRGMHYKYKNPEQFKVNDDAGAPAATKVSKPVSRDKQSV